MPLIMSYLNQTCNLEKRLKGQENSYGEAAFASPVVVPCRRCSRGEWIIDRNGNQLHANTVYYVGTEVAAGDKIDGLNVVDARVMVALNGSSEGYKAVII